MENENNKVFALKLVWTALVIYLFIAVARIKILSPYLHYDIFEGKDSIFYFYAYPIGS